MSTGLQVALWGGAQGSSEPLAQRVLGTGRGEERPPAGLLLCARSRANAQKHLQIKSGGYIMGFNSGRLFLFILACINLI